MSLGYAIKTVKTTSGIVYIFLCGVYYKAVLQNLIDNDQTGFLKGRSIAENICLINNVISYTETKNIPGLLLFVDFEKAFDTIE